MQNRPRKLLHNISKCIILKLLQSEVTNKKFVTSFVFGAKNGFIKQIPQAWNTLVEKVFQNIILNRYAYILLEFLLVRDCHRLPKECVWHFAYGFANLLFVYNVAFQEY